MIAINQDSSATAGDRLRGSNSSSDGGQLWGKGPLSNGDWAVILYNSQRKGNAVVDVTWSELPGWNTTAHPSATVRDVWAKKTSPSAVRSYTVTLKPRDVAMLRITPAGQAVAQFN